MTDAEKRGGLVATAPRRPGPRNDLDVPTAILDAAEREFGRGGVDGVSMRTVAKAAGVAPAAVFYHFSSKDELVEAVTWRRLTPVRESVVTRLRTLGTRPESVDTLDVVEAVLRPFVDIIDSEPVGGMAWMQLYLRFALTQNSIWYTQLEGDIDELFAAAAVRAIPNIADEGVRRRLGIAMFSMLTTLAHAGTAAYADAVTSTGLDESFVSELASFTASGIEGHLHP